MDKTEVLKNTQHFQLKCTVKGKNNGAVHIYIRLYHLLSGNLSGFGSQVIFTVSWMIKSTWPTTDQNETE